MNYVPKTDWNYNDVLSESDMNRIESGIAEGKQLTEAHSVDKNNPHGVTAAQVGAETPAGAQARVDEHVNAGAGAHSASAITISDAENRFTSSNVEGALDELFTSVDNGKAQVKTAIVAKGGTVAGTAPHSFQELADGVTGIEVGDYSKGDTIPLSAFGKNLEISEVFNIRAYYGFHVVSENSFRANDGTTILSYDGKGNVLWTRSTNMGWYWQMTTDPKGNVYYFNANTAYLYLVSPNGATATIGQLEGVSNVTLLGMYCDGTYLYYGDGDGYINKINVSGGNVVKVWRVRPSTCPARSITLDPQGNVYVGFDANYSTIPPYFRKLNPSTGATILSIPMNVNSSGAVYLHVNNSGHVYAHETGSYKLRRIDPVDGKTIWEKSLQPAFLGSDSSGNVYYINRTNNGSVVEKMSPEGTVLWSSDVFGNAVFHPDEHSGVRNMMIGNTIYVPRKDPGQSSSMVAKVVQELTLST